MTTNDKRKVIQFRRKREGKTNYHRRLDLLKSRQLRVVVRKTSKHITAQIVEYIPTGDKVLLHVSGKSLQKLGWEYGTNNTPAAYLIGYALGKKAQESKIKKAILDIGMQRSIKKSKIYAVCKGLVDAGLELPISEEVFPAEDRINGKHIVEFSKTVSENKDTYKNQFAKQKADVANMPAKIEEIKNKL